MRKANWKKQAKRVQAEILVLQTMFLRVGGGGNYECALMDYLCPVKPGFSKNTSTSYVPRLHFMGTFTPVDRSM